MATFLTESKFECGFTQVMNMSASVPVFTQSCLLLITAAWFKKKKKTCFVIMQFFFISRWSKEPACGCSKL